MKYIQYTVVTLALPGFVLAAENVNSLLARVLDWIETLVGLVFAGAVLVFFWGMVRFVANVGNSEAQTKGKYLMIGGVIALFVMSSVWGLVGFLQRSVGVDSAGSVPQYPGIDTNSISL